MAEQTLETAQEQAEKEIASFTSEEFRHGEEVKEKEPAAPKKSADPPPLDQKKEASVEGEGAADIKDGGEGGDVVKDGEETQPDPADASLSKNVQLRINEVTRKRREAERREEAANVRIRELEAKLNAPPPKEEPKKPAGVADEEVDPDAPDPDKFEYGELDSRYIKALATYQADKRFAELKKGDEDARKKRADEEKQQAKVKQLETVFDRGAKKHEDFYEKVFIGAETQKFALSAELGELALASDIGDEVLYHLATHPEEALQVYNTPPLEQARYFGKLEAKLSAGQGAASGELHVSAPAGDGSNGNPAPKTPKAPAPIEGARGAGGQHNVGADTDDFAAFEARANQGV